MVVVSCFNPAHAGNSADDHNDLWVALESAGVSVHVNDPEVCNEKWGGGFYVSNPLTGQAIMLICQNYGEGAGLDNQVTWTPNDYDTLRHEAHHVIQDCIGGELADRDLDPLFEDPDRHRQFVLSSLSPDKIEWIIKNYGEMGANAETIILELEAFAVAEDVPASKIAEGVRQMCGTKNKLTFD